MKRIVLYSLLVIVVLFGFGGRKICSIGKRKDVSRRITDVQHYRHFLKAVLSDLDLFQTFRRAPIFTLFYDNTTYAEGLRCIKVIEQQTPELLQEDIRPLLRMVDTVGDPQLACFPGVGCVSPSALYYLKVASDLKYQFGSMERLRVIEIGSGSGALCKLLHLLFDIEHYTIVDTCAGIRLAKKSLESSGLDHIVYISPDHLKMESSNLLISHNAMTESSATLQNKYLRHLVPYAERGYLVCNFFPRHFRVRPHEKKELVSLLTKVQPHGALLPEDPRRGADNFRFVWGVQPK